MTQGLELSIQNQLRLLGGTEVDQQQVIYSGAIELASDTRAEFSKLMKQRQIPGCGVWSLYELLPTYLKESQKNSTKELLKASEEYTIVGKEIRPGEGTLFAVKVASYGRDLVIKVRHFERSKSNESSRILIGLVLGIGGMLFFWTIIGFAVMIAGFSKLFSKSRLTGPDAEESALLREIVLETVSQSVSNCQS